MKTRSKRSFCLWILLPAILVSLIHREATAAANTNTTLRVLFLGDRAGHRPAERFAILEPVLAKRNIEMSYTESMQDLNASRLATVDCLMIYANITRISPEQEKALMDFVAGGGGLAPIHCASYCFHNSSNYIELVGAQFRRHGTGVFKETVIVPDHPVVQGLSPIESWDETYVHHRHNTNRIVLAERRDADGAEPYTWVREHGKGRVFYTAWGHDQRTWTNAGFQALVESGVRWASANSPNQIQKRSGLKPLEYLPSQTPVPNYLPNRGGQAQIQTTQKPLEPAESMQHMVTLPGFDLSLFASEPDIVKPVWLAWDARGRLWIVETVDYPNELQPQNAGRDRMKILEDTDGDGRADKFTVFADGLSIPTGFVFANGGVIVIHSGKTEFLKDTNGDDKADERKVLFSGWSMRDTHATASNLRYGFDGWIWGTVGYSGFQGTVGGKQIQFAQGIFRFKPDGSALEFVRSSNNNTWGLGITEDNLIFGSTANNNASMYMPIANRYYEQVSGWSAARMETIADSQRIYPLTDKVRQVDAHGRYTAGAGSAIYTARQFPRHYWNRFQFVSEPTGHVLGQFFLEPHGTDFTARNARSLLASDDEWTAPVCAEVGPDGALWMVDWYNYIVQHNPTPRGFQTGKGAAYETPLRDKTRGRIYRIAYGEKQSAAARRQSPRLDNATPAQLVAALKNDNMLWRMHAERLLLERGKKDVVPALCDLVRDQGVDEIGLNTAAIHALWTLQGLGALQDPKFDALAAALGALKHPSAGVRRAAVTVLPRDAAGLDAIMKGGLLEDADPHVRLAALLAVSEMPANPSAGASVLAVLRTPRDSQDRWIPDAVIAAGARQDVGLIKAALTSNPSAEAGPIVRMVTAHYAQREPKDIITTLAALPTSSPQIAVAVLEGMIAGWPQDKVLNLGESDKQTLNKCMEALPETSRDRLLALAQRWGHPDLFGTSVAAIIETLKKQVTDASLSDVERVAAAKRLVGLEDKPEVWKIILAQVTLLTPPDLAIGLINALGDSRDGRIASAAEGQTAANRGFRGGGNRTTPAADAMISGWPTFTPVVRRSAINILMRRSEWAVALLVAVEDGDIKKSDIAPEHWTQLKQNPNPFVSRRAERLAERSAIVSTGREEIVAKLLPLAKEPGDAARGKRVFTVNCAVCHMFDGQGKSVGPDLNGIGARERTDILQEILDPNRSVEANYRSWTVTMKDGESYSGRLESETQTSVEILDTSAQKHVIQRKDIASLTVSQLSIMPAGFETLLSADDLKGLLEYLTQTHPHASSP